jgi:hypothetical protein
VTSNPGHPRPGQAHPAQISDQCPEGSRPPDDPPNHHDWLSPKRDFHHHCHSRVGRDPEKPQDGGVKVTLSLVWEKALIRKKEISLLFKIPVQKACAVRVAVWAEGSLHTSLSLCAAGLARHSVLPQTRGICGAEMPPPSSREVSDRGLLAARWSPAWVTRTRCPAKKRTAQNETRGIRTISSRVLQLTPVIPATQEAEMGRTEARGQPGKEFSR